MFKSSANLIEKNNKVKKCNLDFKYYLEFLEKTNETLKYKTTNVRNQDGTCETCVSIKKEVKYLDEILINKGKTLTWFHQVKGLS